MKLFSSPIEAPQGLIVIFLRNFSDLVFILESVFPTTSEEVFPTSLEEAFSTKLEVGENIKFLLQFFAFRFLFFI